MSDSPGQELLALASQRPPVNPFGAKYTDPVLVALLKLPYVSYDRRQALAEAWDEWKPDEYVYRALAWYARHDQNLLLFARLAVTVSPIVLMHVGVGVGRVVSFVVASLFIVEWLNRVRVEKEREQAMEDAKREYWRQVERPRINARERELWQELAEERDWEEEEDSAESDE
ncbi:hypothetical protein [Halostella salina]|uniref:hypothetical protein n=1 Tax=Halostella salina TaxID=1547897 RepID=UPI000EF7AA60|nr:hypothetical protein [Halostella salina]